MAVAILGSFKIVEVGWSLKCIIKIIRNYIKSTASDIQLREIADLFRGCVINLELIPSIRV